MNAPYPRFAHPQQSDVLEGLWDADFPVQTAKRTAGSETLLALHRTTGVTRAVVTERMLGDGMDRAALLQQLGEGEGRYRGIVRLTWADGPNAIDYLHEMGVRGARVEFAEDARRPWNEAELLRLSELIAPFGWNLSMPVWSASPARQLAMLRQLRVPVILDSGSYLETAQLLRRRAFSHGTQIWLRMTGALDDDEQGDVPAAPDAVEERNDLLKRHQDRLLWGSGAGTDAELKPSVYRRDLNHALATVADSALRDAMFVANPAGLFDF